MVIPIEKWTEDLHKEVMKEIQVNNNKITSNINNQVEIKIRIHFNI